MLARLPRILHTIIEDAVAEEADMEVICGHASSSLVAMAASRRIDITIIGEDDLDTVSALLGARPHMDVFAVVPTGGETMLYEMRPCRVRLGEVSATSLVQAIREAGQNARSRAAGVLVGRVLDAGGGDR